MRVSKRIATLRPVSYDPDTFQIPEAPGMPQLLSKEKYASMMSYFTECSKGENGYYAKEPLDIHLRDTLCLKCMVYFKSSSLNSEWCLQQQR